MASMWLPRQGFGRELEYLVLVWDELETIISSISPFWRNEFLWACVACVWAVVGLFRYFVMMHSLSPRYA
jgi:hypothetical protein